MRDYDYDIGVLSDLGYPGGNSSSLVEETKAAAAAGYSTAFIDVPAVQMKRRRSFNHKIIHCLSAGMASSDRRPPAYGTCTDHPTTPNLR
jgi:hypothetical protein